MSVIGFDIGNESCVIAAAKRGGVDVLLNNESKRETPAVVSFGEKQRFLGSAGAAFATSNPKSTISQIKRLIGKLYKEVEEDLKLLPFTTREGPRGEILIELDYLKQKWTFTPVEILAMLFKHLKQLTEKNLETNVVDCVIGIPSYFTDLQRRLYLDAANLADLKPLRLIHDGTAIALGYGMYKTDFSESGRTIVMFVDVGHSDTQVTIAAFQQGGMKILSHSFDPNLGGRDFDEVLFNYFAAQFKEKFKIDVNSNVRASARLRASCEKVKKVLSANAEAPLSIECLIGDTDVRGVITRDEFEKLSSSLLERVIVPCNRAIKFCGLTMDKIHTIELVGSGSRIPAITRYLTSFFEKEPTRTLNSSECVARGCALRCAMLSPSLKVREYQIVDSFSYSIVIPSPHGEVSLFSKGSSFPNECSLPAENYQFYFQVAYRNERDFPAGVSNIVGRFGIGSDELYIAEKVKVEFTMKLNNNGIVELGSATVKEDKRSMLGDLLGFNPLANTQILSLPITENQDVSTTNDELDKAKEKEETLAEQDMKNLKMCVIGFDIGNESCVIAAANGKGINAMWNDETQCVVSFGEKQRFFGSEEAAFATADLRSTVSQIKRLIGKLYKEVEEDLKLLPFTTREGPSGGILIELEYLKEKWNFTPVEILAMLFKHLKQLTEKNIETSVFDCVIGIPSYFTDLQRRLYLDAANLAGLKPLRLMHDGTAIALSYGMYKTDFSNSGPTNVMFVDIGHCDTQVTLAAFEQGRMKILSHSFDQRLGGRDFDEVLFEHFVAHFNQKFKIDVNSNARASARLRAACEKMKKVLSANAEATLSMECLIGDTDVTELITREEFENLSSKLLDRVIDPCCMALKDSGISVDKIHAIVLVGSGSCIPAITKVLTLFFKKEPTRTLNASKNVARGCALQCAMLSSSLVVPDYKIEDSFPYSIVIPSPKGGEFMLFPKGSPFPKEKILHLIKIIPFNIQVAYGKDRDFPAGISHIVGHFGIGSDEPSNEEKVNFEFTMKLNKNGIVEVDSATVSEDKHNFGINALCYMLNRLPNIRMLNTEPNMRMLNLPITENVDVSTTNDDLKEAERKEKLLAEQEMKVETTKDQRSTLESFFYDTRSKMSVIGFDIGNESCVIADASGNGVDVVWNESCEIPAVVSFGEKRRYLGSIGASFAAANPKSTVSQIKRLMGKLYKEVEEDLKLLPFATSEGPRGGILIELEYMKKKWTFTPVEILAMLLKHLKQLTENKFKSTVVECVIGIPSYFTDLQRRLYLDAAFLAGLKPLRLIHDGTAIALGYGMYKTGLSESGPTNVMFVDIGHCDTQVTLAAFEPGKMKILSHSFDDNLGGRDFDEVLFKHFATQFNQKYKIDVYFDARASKMLRASCEKLKKVLSTNSEAQFSIDCLIGNTDVTGFVTREEFENLSFNLLERIIVPCHKALKQSGLGVDEMHSIELVGSGSRIPAITKVLTLVLKKEPTRRLNGRECVARGCALCCSMLSTTPIVGDYKVEDSFPYSIVISSTEEELIHFPKGSPFPIHQTLERNIFQVVRFAIPSHEPFDAEVEFEFRVRLNDHGIVEIDSASILEDKHYSAMSLQISKNLDAATMIDELHEAKEKEKMLVELEIKAEETKDPINAVESFISDTRSKLISAYRRFATDSEKEVIIKNMRETEYWLYEDSDGSSDQEYTRKLNHLKKLIEPIENRYEENARAEVTKALQTCIAKYQSRAYSLPAGKKEKVNNVCKEAVQWLINAVSQNNSSPMTLSTKINQFIDTVERKCKSIIRSEPSIPRHEELVDPKTVWEKAADESLQTCNADDRSHATGKEEKILEDKSHFNLSACIYGLNVEPSTRMLNIPIPDNVDVSTTIDELNEAKRKEEMLAEQDKKVETIKEQRNILQSFVFDTRYKLFESVENRYGEDDIAKAKKALEDCIAKYRSRADSLRADHKAKVKDVCTKAEQWLVNAFSKKHPSLKTLLGDINNATKLVESDCESVIRSKSIYSWLEIPVVSHPKDQPVDSENATKVTKEAKALEACIVKYRSRAETLPVDMKAKFNNLFRKVEEHFLRVVSQKRFSPKALENEINSITNNVESECEKIIKSKSSYSLNEEPNYWYQVMDSVNGIKKATKAFQNCIAEHRLKAESFPVDIKEKVLTECIRAEAWVKRSSPTASSAYITKVIEDFKSNCQSIILSNPSFSRHHEESNQTMESENAKSALQTCIANYRLHAESVTADNKEKVLNECDNAEMWLTNLSQKQISPDVMTTYIIDYTQHLKRHCESIIN